jgi:hypothetical protein
MHLEGFGNLRLDTSPTTQRRNRILEHHRDMSPDRFVSSFTQTAEFGVLKLDAAIMWPYQPNDGSTQRGFA